MNYTKSGLDHRILMLSQRNLDLKVYQCWMYEFEDVICEVDAVEMLTPISSNYSNLNKLIQQSANRAARLIGAKKYPETFLSKNIINKEYDLFFAVFAFPSQLLYLNSLKGWKEKCHKRVCYLGEVWTKDLENPKTINCLKLLKDFDHIFLHVKGSISKVSDIIQKPCHFMPVGIDAIKFCPYPSPPDRVIDVYSMGRRSQVTHKTLLELAESRKIFYVYDTTAGFSVIDYKEHRSMSSNLIKRSRYFIAYKHNINLSGLTGGQEELGSRLFEGIAGGAVMLGIPPSCDAYDECFNWQDVVIPIPYEAVNISEILSELDCQPERLAKIRQDNVVNSLLRHDWVYRWNKILDIVGIVETSEIALRKTNFQNLSKMVLQSNSI